jgi:hypothetical protein
VKLHNTTSVAAHVHARWLKMHWRMWNDPC